MMYEAQAATSVQISLESEIDRLRRERDALESRIEDVSSHISRQVSTSFLLFCATLLTRSRYLCLLFGCLLASQTSVPPQIENKASLAPSPEKRTLADLNNGWEGVPQELGIEENILRLHGPGDQADGDAEHLPQGWKMKVLRVRTPFAVFLSKFHAQVRIESEKTACEILMTRQDSSVIYVNDSLKAFSRVRPLQVAVGLQN